MNCFWVGKFKILPQMNKVILPKQEFRLEERVMKVLCLLVENKSNVLSKEQIIEQLWPQQSIEPEVITKAVFEIRKLFNDDPKSPRFIETVPRKGYVFIGEVKHKQTRANFKLDWKYLCIFSLALALVISQIYSLTSSEIQSIIELETRYISDQPISQVIHNKQHNQLLFIKGEKYKRKIYAQNLENNEVTALKFDKANYLAIKQQNNKVYALNCVKNCQILQLTNELESQALLSSEHRLLSFAVAPNNHSIAVQVYKNNTSYIALFDAESNKTKLHYLPSDEYVKQPEFFGNDQLYYIESSIHQVRLMQYSLIDKIATPINTPFERFSRFTRLNDETLAIVGRFQTKLGLWQYNLNTKAVTLLTRLEPNEQLKNIHHLIAEKQLAYAVSVNNIEVRSKGSIEVNVLNESFNLYANWSTRKQGLIFASNRTGNYDIWFKKGDSERKLTNIEASYIEQVRLSHRQDAVAFTYLKNNKKYLAIYSFKTQKLIHQNGIPRQNQLIDWRTSKQLILAEPQGKNDQSILYTLPVQSDQQASISSQPIKYSYGQNTYIYYSDKIVLQKADGQISTLIDFDAVKLSTRANSIQMSEVGFFYVTQQSKTQTIYFYNFASNNTEKIFTIHNEAYVTDLGFSHGQPYLIYDVVAPVKSKIKLLSYASKP